MHSSKGKDEYEIGVWRGSKTASRTRTRREAGLNENGREGRCLTVWRLHEKGFGPPVPWPPGAKSVST